MPTVRAALSVLLLLLAALTVVCAAQADGAVQERVSVALTGGSLKAGRAKVQARITNNGARALLGLRIGAYYDSLDALPATDAPWRLHEFLLEPPLTPGAATTLEFTDENAAEYVLLRVDYARMSLGISVEGAAPFPTQAELLELDGVQYVAARDLAGALGAKLTQAGDKRVTLGLPGPGVVLVYRPGDAAVTVDGRALDLQHSVLEREGRSWLAVHGVCGLLGYEADYDLAANLLSLARSAVTQ